MSSSMSGYTGMKGATGAVSGSKTPKGFASGQIQNFTPEMMELFRQMFSHASPDSFLSKLASGDEGMFNQIEAPALKQFSALQGNLSSRFSGMGSTGARRSSGFQNTSNAAASDFAQQLQANRIALQRNAATDLKNLSMELLNQRPYENYLVQKPQKESTGSGWGSLAGAGLGAVGGFFAGGPAGALGGAKLGYDFGSSF